MSTDWQRDPTHLSAIGLTGFRIQPCPLGTSAAESPHRDLKLNGVGAVKDARQEEHHTCVRCRAVFARILAGPPARQIWMHFERRPALTQAFPEAVV
jgi:hypothetical protein